MEYMHNAKQYGRKHAEDIRELAPGITAYMGLPYADHRDYIYRGLTKKQQLWASEIPEHSVSSIEVGEKVQRKWTDWRPDAPAYIDESPSRPR